MKFVVVRTEGSLSCVSYLAPCGHWALDISKARVFEEQVEAETQCRQIEADMQKTLQANPWLGFKYSVESRTKVLEERLVARTSGGATG